MKRIGIAANLSKAGVLEVVEEIRRHLNDFSVETILETKLAEALGQMQERALDEAELLLVLGGDGTILSHAAWALQTQIPLLGINLGHVGFLNNIELSELRPSLEKLLRGEFASYSRMMLVGELNGKKHFALNDFTLFKKHFSNTIDVQVKINDVCMAEFACDGVLISTPVGSTAYSLSAGGPIVSPNVDAVLVTPVCAHTLSARPIVVAPQDQISLAIKEGHSDVGLLIIDGCVQEEVRNEEEIQVRVSEKKVQFLAVNDYNFFELLREKLY